MSKNIPEIVIDRSLPFSNSFGRQILLIATFGALSQMLILIVNLSIIQHTFLISLTYPESLQNFWSTIDPIITFDLFQSQELNRVIFDFDQIKNQSPLSVQFGLIGYNSTFSIDNLGGIFWASCFMPALVALVAIINYFLYKLTSCTRLIQMLKGFLSRVL